MNRLSEQPLRPAINALASRRRPSDRVGSTGPTLAPHRSASTVRRRTGPQATPAAAAARTRVVRRCRPSLSTSRLVRSWSPALSLPQPIVVCNKSVLDPPYMGDRMGLLKGQTARPAEISHVIRSSGPGT